MLIPKPLLVLLALVVGLGASCVAIGTLAKGSPTTSPKTLDRNLEPVIITGRAVRDLMGFPVDRFFVYAYEEGAWRQIPAQVDEVTAAGAYTSTEDGRLDANDQIVFMAQDLGDQAPTSSPISASLVISPGWYEIEVTDPLSPTQKGWAYLVHSRVLTPTFTADYVGFNGGLHRIKAAGYHLGFGVTHPGADYLALGDSRVDILDRTKLRYGCSIRFICPINETRFSPLPDNLIKDGPVRVIVRGGSVLAYGSMLYWTANFKLPSFLQSVRLSMDFTPAVSGAVYYNAVVTEGVTVNGMTDTVAAEPVSRWWQLSASTGTLVQVADMTSIRGTLANYYVDNAAFDESDTGDHRHYGETGISIENPNPVFTYTFALYMLSGMQPNLGATFEAFFTHPFSITTSLHGDPQPAKAYLPLVSKSASRTSQPPRIRGAQGGSKGSVFQKTAKESGLCCNQGGG